MRYLKYSIFFFSVILVFTGCATFRLSESEKKIYSSKTINDFLQSANVEIVDGQFVKSGAWLEKRDIVSESTSGAEVTKKDIEIKILLPECKMIKGFWENPYSILTVLVLTLGNIYECETIVELTETETDRVYVYQTSTEVFGASGLVAIIRGPFYPFFIQKEKKTRINALLSNYMKEKDVPVEELKRFFIFHY